MSLLLESTIKASLILGLALGLMPLLGTRSAAFCHWVLSAAIACAALAPLVQLAAPSWRLPIGLRSAAPIATSTNSIPALNTSMAAASVTAGERHAGGPRTQAPLEGDAAALVAALRGIWIAGAVLGVATLVVGFGRLTRLSSRARPVAEGIWSQRAEEIGREYGIRRPVVLLQSQHPTLLVTWGLFQPKVILPAAAPGWQVDRVSLVLAHELAHVRRGDWIAQLVAELLRAVYWFNPLIWVACSRLRRESEQACDDAVLVRGVEGADYATHLVEIARELQQRAVWMPAAAIARSSGLERRVRAMLDARLNRRPLSRSACVATVLALLTITVPIAGFAASQAVFATVTGSIVDPLNGLLPDVRLILTNQQSSSKYEIRSDGNGRYEFVGLPPGEYLLEARLPGFAVLQGKLTLAGQTVQQDLALQIGSLEETVTVIDEAVPSRPDPAEQQSRNERAARRRANTCPELAAAAGPRIGGNIRPPMKINDVPPEYPSHLRGTGTEGTVVLLGRIGKEGMMDEVGIISSPGPDFASAALEAVRQWQFDATLLNCMPVEVSIKVTVRFQHRS
jgi:TonB family protein